MSLEDFISYFRTLTVGHSEQTFISRPYPADIGMHGDPDDSWAVMHLRFKTNGPNAFFRLAQMDRRYLDDKASVLEYEYAQITMLVVKKARVPPRHDFGEATQEYAYMEGMIGRKAAVNIRIKNVRSGDYYLLYKVDWKDHHKCRQLKLMV